MYKVTITKIEEKMVPTRAYQRIKEETSTDDGEYGYVTGEELKIVETDLYEQTVEELEISEVVAVVNK